MIRRDSKNEDLDLQRNDESDKKHLNLKLIKVIIITIIIILHSNKSRIIKNYKIRLALKNIIFKKKKN